MKVRIKETHPFLPSEEKIRPQRAVAERKKLADIKEKQAKDPEFSKPVAGYPNWDTYETSLVLENDERTYRWLHDWKKNFDRKMKRGRFDQSEAEYAVYKYIVPEARTGRRFKLDSADPQINRQNVDYGFLVSRILKLDE